MVLARIVLFLLLAPAQAQAGAWARGEGNTFLSLGGAGFVDPATIRSGDPATEGYVSLLLERGLSERLTFGLDALAADDGKQSVTLVLTRAFAPTDGPHRFALNAGLGMSRHDGVTEPLLRFGASWGRGTETPLGNGWIAADVTLLYRTASKGVVLKADLTYGINRSDRLKLFAQLQAARYPDADPVVRLVPSMALRLGEGRHLELGLPVAMDGSGQIGLRLGTWLEF